MRKVLNFLILISVFLDSIILIRKPANLFLYYFFYLGFIILFIISNKKIKIDRNFVFFAILVTGISCFRAYPSGDIMLVWKQMFAILFSSITFYLFIVYNDYDIEKIFRQYLHIAKYICIIGLFQEFFYILGFEYGYNFRNYFSYWSLYTTEYQYYIKINSIVSEPSHLAIALAPALFTSIDRLFDKRNTLINYSTAIIIIVTYILTGSALAMLAFLIAVVLIAVKYSILNLLFLKKYLPYTLSLVLVLFFVGKMVYTVPFIKLRVDDTWELINTSNKRKISKELNLSTFSLYSNFTIAMESFNKNPVFGSGIGTHPANYERYILKFFDKNIEGVRMQINKDDANSLLVRLISETGLFGISLFLIFLFKNFIPLRKTENSDYYLWIINNSILLFLILRLIRFGNYSLLGFFLFAFLYYFSKRQSMINSTNALKKSS